MIYLLSSSIYCVWRLSAVPKKDEISLRKIIRNRHIYLWRIKKHTLYLNFRRNIFLKSSRKRFDFSSVGATSSLCRLNTYRGFFVLINFRLCSRCTFYFLKSTEKYTLVKPPTFRRDYSIITSWVMMAGQKSTDPGFCCIPNPVHHGPMLWNAKNNWKHQEAELSYGH